MSDLLILIPFVGLIIRNVLPRNARVLPAVLWIVIFGFQTVAAALQPFGVIDWSFMAPLSKLIGFTLAADNLSLLLLASVGIAGIAAVLVGHATLKTPRTRFTFGNLLMISLLGINGIAMVRDLFTLYVFVEVTSVAAFILVTLREGPGAFEGAWKYLILSAIALFGGGR
jgi:formate hydrogenlyase subunit 3/multisubunit Na+/H+ antiporter MnhD subunit